MGEKTFSFPRQDQRLPHLKIIYMITSVVKMVNLKRMQSDFCNLVLLEISLWSCWHKIYFYQQMDRRVFRTCHICITVILKRSKFVRKVKDIRKLTERRLEEWKQNNFDELLNEAHQHTTSHSNIQFTIQALNLSLIYQDRIARPKNNIERGSP